MRTSPIPNARFCAGPDPLAGGFADVVAAVGAGAAVGDAAGAGEPPSQAQIKMPATATVQRTASAPPPGDGRRRRLTAAAETRQAPPPPSPLRKSFNRRRLRR